MFCFRICLTHLFKRLDILVSLSVSGYGCGWDMVVVGIWLWLEYDCGWDMVVVGIWLCLGYLSGTCQFLLVSQIRFCFESLSGVHDLSP